MSERAAAAAPPAADSPLDEIPGDCARDSCSFEQPTSFHRELLLQETVS